MADITRFDSAALFSIFKNEEGENLLPFDEMAALLDLGDLPEVPLIPNPQIVTTGGPGQALSMAEGLCYARMPPGLDMFPNTLAPLKTPIPAAVIASTSGGADSDHTRAPGWGSNPSSDGGGDSDGSDMDGERGGELQQPDQGTPAPSSTQLGNGGGGGGSRSGKGAKASSGVKKRRQRNADQMESNRVAQQKYRMRKKVEQNALQHAVDMLTAQVAALKAVEVRNGELEASNASLSATVASQGSSLAALQQQAAAQEAELHAARAALSASQAQVAAQGRLVLDQQARLRLQEQVIASLKDRLKERIDEAMLHVVPGTVCEKMVAAVKATLYGAKDVNGLQETLAQLPEHLVHELCKNIFHVCKETWPELRTRCSQQVGGACMTGAA